MVKIDAAGKCSFYYLEIMSLNSENVTAAGNHSDTSQPWASVSSWMWMGQIALHMMQHDSEEASDSHQPSAGLLM